MPYPIKDHEFYRDQLYEPRRQAAALERIAAALERLLPQSEPGDRQAPAETDEEALRTMAARYAGRR